MWQFYLYRQLTILLGASFSTSILFHLMRWLDSFWFSFVALATVGVILTSIWVYWFIFSNQSLEAQIAPAFFAVGLLTGLWL